MRAVQTRGVFGKPRAHSSNTGFGSAATSVGLIGEQLTAQIIDRYGSQAMVFHGVKLPIKLRTDIDHLIVRDNALLAIDSKYWSPGRHWACGQRLYRGLSKIDLPVAMTHAVNALTTMLGNAPDHVDVLTVVHSKKNRARIGASARKLSQPIVAASAADATIRQWVTSHPGEPDHALASDILSIYRKGAVK